MNGSDKFKKRIEDFLNEKSQSDALFAPMLEKASKSVEDCLKYIIAEVRKTGLCAFDDSEIFDMAVRYYTDDSICTPAEIPYRVTTNQPKKAALFSAPLIPANETAQEIPSVQALPVPAPLKPTPKTAQTALTLFDL
ncbi:Cas9 inhibitor AcrIIA9 family protein [Flavobacterium mesophilum]|uniref:Cas9 inhibitor AcrIIA9 family protein n=1 Tax=Flavobacterium mesophilum TaxID=3143495 RepID=UPI0031D14440